MSKKTGLEYLDLGIGDSGMIDLDQLGISHAKTVPGQDIISLNRRNRIYNPNIGDRVSYADDLEGISNIGEMSDEELQNAKYDTQSGLEMVANALKGMAAIAGTTYVSNTVGLGNTLLEMTWDNTVNNYMAELENEARQRNQIYRPSDYDQWSLGQKLGNGVFWADLVQNLGFTIGAGAAAFTFGNIPGVSTALKAAPKLVQHVAPSLFGALGEASIEAVHHKDQEVQQKTNLAINEYNKLIANALDDSTAQSLSRDLAIDLASIEEDSRKAGNFVFGANVGLLTLSNTIEFGDIFSRGFSTGRKVANSARRVASSVMTDAGERLEKESIGAAAGMGLLGGLVNNITEAGEEVSQGIITKAVSWNADYDSFNNSKFNPEKREEVSGMLQSLIAGYAEAMHDPNTATEAAMGFFTGAIGMPRLKKSIVPIRLEGGMIGEVSSAISDTRELNRTIDSINARLDEDKALNAYYEGLTRHLALQDAEDVALEGNDHKAFADANSAKFISDIMMFDKVGRLDMLQNIIDTAANLPDDGIQSLIQETAVNGNGPFMTNGNPMSTEEVRGILSEKTKALKSKINTYISIRDNLLSKYDTLSDDSIEEAMFYKMSIDDLENRQKYMSNPEDSLVHLIKTEIINIEAFFLNEDDYVGAQDAWYSTNPKQRVTELSKKDSPLNKAVKAALQSDAFVVPKDVKDSIQQSIEDLYKIVETKEKYAKEFDQLISNPTKANQKNKKLKQDIATKQEKETHIAENRNIASQVINSSIGDTFVKVRSGAINLDDVNIPDLGDLEGTFTDKVKEVEKLQNASVAVEDELINDDSVSGQAKKDAVSLFMYGAERTQDTATVLEPQTFETFTPQQAAEALGINPDDYDDVLTELEKRMPPAIEALSKALPNVEASIKEAEKMSATADDGVIKTTEKGNDPITSIKSISNEGVEPKAVTTPSRTVTSSAPSTTMSSDNWASGYSYMYTGKDEKHVGKTYKQFVEDEISALESKSNLTEEDKTLLQQYRNTKKVIDFLYQEGVYTRERQLLVQEGDKVHFIVRPEVTEEIAFIAVKGPNNTYSIVGNLSPSQSKGIIERYRQSGSSTLYVDSATSIVVDKYTGRISYSRSNDRHGLNTLYPQGFILGIDLSSNTTTSDIRTQANSKEDTPKNEEEQKIKPTKEGKPGAVYVMVPTSNTKKDSYTVVEAVSRTFNMLDENNPVVKFLLDLIEAEIPVSEKLQYLQSILDIDVFIERQSLTLEGDTTTEKYTFTVRNNGKTQTYLKSESVSTNDLIKFILDNVTGQARYTVDRHYINDTFPGTGEDYNTFIGNVLEANLYSQNPTTVGDWFRIKPISTNGSMVVGKAISEIKPHTKSGENVTKDGSNVTIEKDDHSLSINTETWEVTRDGKVLTPSEYNIKTYTYLARTFLQNLGHTNGLHITPWGLFNLDESKFDGNANSLIINAELAKLLADVNSKSIPSKITALITYEDLPESSKTPALNKYFTKAELELEKQGYTWTHPSNVETMWERGFKENITVQNESIDPNLSSGEIKVIGRAPIIEKDGNIISKGIVDIKRGPDTQVSSENTTSVITEEADNLDWLKEKSHKTIYNTLNDKAKNSFKQATLSLEGASRKRYINDTMRRLKGMTVEERNEYLKEPYFRKANNTTSVQVIDIDKEVTWLSKVLPQFSKDDRLRVVKGLIKVANSGERAWGMFKDGVMYIAKNAASGTVYHEAFHSVVHTLLSDKERVKLFAEARKQYGLEDSLDLEEAMAEDFRRYTEFQISDSSSYLKNMWSNIKNWTKFIFGQMTAIESTFWRINKGLYRRRALKESAEQRYRKLTIKNVVNDIKPYQIDKAYDVYTKYKEVDAAVRKIIRDNNINWKTYAHNAGDLEALFKDIPNYDKVVMFVEVPYTGKSTPILYTDMWSFAEVSRIKNNPSTKYELEDMSRDEYLSEKARIEQDLADYDKDGLDSDEYTSNDEEIFTERERRFDEKRMYSNLTNKQKDILKKQGVSARAYDAFSPADKESFIRCNS